MEIGLFIHGTGTDSLRIIYDECLPHALLATLGTLPDSVNALFQV